MFHPNEEKFKEIAGYEIDGFWYPRVTKIVEIKAKPALYMFYGEAPSYQAGKSITEKSAEEGTKIHETVEALLLGKTPVISPDIRPAALAFLSFFEANNIQTAPEYVERRVVNLNDRYAGTVDALALIEGKFGVLDIKTSAGIYRDYNLQTSAYMAALKDQFKNLQTRWILRIDQAQNCLKCGAHRRVKGGREKIKAYQAHQKSCNHEWSEIKGEIELKELPYWQEDFQAFLGAKKLWEWENDEVLKKIGYLS